jgi:CHAT domain-containing protein
MRYWSTLYLALALFLVAASQSGVSTGQPGSGGGPDWLVGTWEGRLTDLPAGPDSGRTLKVLSVAPDGTAQGTWFTTGQDEYLASIKVAGAHIQIISAARSKIVLTLQGERQLVGSLTTSAGATYRVTLERINASVDPALAHLARQLVGYWEGEVLAHLSTIPSPQRSLYIDLVGQKDGRWIAKGRFGKPGRPGPRVDIEVYHSGTRPAIRFVLDYGGTVRLELTDAKNLAGTITVPGTGFPGSRGGGEDSFQLERKESLEPVIGGPQRKLPSRTAAFKQVGDELAVGKNRTGEACGLRLVHAVVSANPYERFGLFCEGWSQPSGQITRFAASKDFPPKRLVSEGGWYQSLAGRVGDCRSAEPTTLSDGTAAALRECTRAEGGWRVLILTAIIGQEGYALETLPTNFPVLELAVQVLAGKRPAEAPVDSSVVSAAIRRAETMVGATGALVGVQDVGAHATLYELGQLRDYQADWAAAEAAFRRALEIEERLAGPNRPQSGYTITWIGAEAGFQRRFAESDQLFTRAEPLVKQDYVPWHYPQFLTYRSVVERNKGRHTEAIRYGEEAIRIYEGQRVLNETNFAESLTQTVRAYWATGRLNEVETGLLRVLTLLDKPGPAPGFRAWRVGETHHDLGVFYLNSNRLPEARKHLELALKQRESFLGPSLRATWSLMELGRLGRAEGALLKGLEAYRRAADIATKDPLTRGTLGVDAFAGYFNSLLDLGSAAPDQADTRAAELFVATQIPREGETAKAITAMSARLASADPAVRSATRDYQEAVRRRDRAREAYSAEPFRQGGDRSPEREEALKEEWRRAEDKVALLEEGLQAKFPKYVGLTAAKPLSAADLTQLLRPGEAVLSVVQTSRTAYVLVVRDGTVSVHRAPVTREAMERDVKRLRSGLDVADGQLRPFDRGLANQLYQSLLAPVATKLQGITHLIVVSSGPLQSLPLGLLVTQPTAGTDGDDYRNTAWLARQFAISVLPSLSSLKDLRATVSRPAAPRPFIGFGDPAFRGTAGAARGVTGLANVCRDGALTDMELLRGLPRLPETAGELRQMAQTLGAGPESVVLGADATEGRVRSTDLSQYRVIAFATHGLLPGDLQCKTEPGLALTPPASPSAAEDGLLDASEVAQLNLDADFVVLSACNTAAPDGRLLGEALSGLARGFFYAGARGLLVSHWIVASQPTAALTTGLFAEYAKNRTLGRAEALRRAEQALWKETATAHPALWAPFVFVGDGGPEARQP